MTLGLVLIAAAIGLLSYNHWENERAGDSAASVVDALEEYLESVETQDVSVDSGDSNENDGMEMMEVDGNGYIGTLTIPTLNLELPIQAEWSYAGMKIAPGRYAGSVWTDDMVICGHNYARHFGNLKYLEAGDTLYFTDINGNTFHYAVEEILTLAPTDTDVMIEDTGEWDLTMFTCTLSGQARVTVRCVRTDKQT